MKNTTRQVVQINFSVLALLLSLSPALAQKAAATLTPSPDIIQYAHTAWTAQSGAFRGGITCLTQTSDGYLWVGTAFGLVRFDGVRFVEWTPPGIGNSQPDAEIYSLLAARDGSLWIGRHNDLIRWKDGIVTRLPEFDNNYVFALAEDNDGTIWVGIGGRDPKRFLFQIRSDVITCVEDEKLGHDYVAGLYKDRRGRIWATLSKQLCVFEGDNLQCYPYSNGSPRHMAEDQEGRLIVAGSRVEVVTLDGKASEYPIRLADKSIGAGSVLKDREGALWVGTVDKGLIHVHDGGVDSFTKADGLSSNGPFIDIFEDREGTIWAASLDGLDRFRRLAIPSLTARQGLSSDSIHSILSAKDGSIWAGTADGLNYLKDNTVQVYSRRHGLSSDGIGSLIETSRGRFMVLIDGLFRLEDGRFTRLPTKLSDITFGYVEDARGDIWLVDNKYGLTHLNSEGALIEVFPKGSTERRPFELAYDSLRDGLWISTKDGNLGFFKNGKIIEHYGPDDGLGRGILEDVQAKKDGAVWVGTAMGLARLRDGKIAVLGQQNGLPCNMVHWMREDDAGTAWLYTECGVVHLSREDLAAWDAQTDHRVTPLDFFSNLDGAQNATMNSWYSPHVAKTTDGRLLFVTNYGIGVIDPHHIFRNAVPPPVHIEAVIADRKNYPAQDGLRLPPLTHDLEIDFTALSLAAPEKVRFRYKLEGYDADWQESDIRRQVFYNDLRPGNYTFRVLACNNDGVWDETGATLTFRVAPAWYQTNWFLLLCMVSGLLIMWGIYSLRVRQIARAISVRFDERLAERTRIARELHDTLLQTVQGSKLVADDALENSDDAVHMQHAMKRLSGWLGQATQEGRAALNSLRTSTIETNDLAAGLRRATEECLLDRNMAVKFSVAGGSRDMHPIARDEIYRIQSPATKSIALATKPSAMPVNMPRPANWKSRSTTPKTSPCGSMTMASASKRRSSPKARRATSVYRECANGPRASTASSRWSVRHNLEPR
jgi:Two component regulator propeller./Histidine kinase./Y_Y_Y domain.